MKIRFGFVSNSSSSSYVCEVCGNAESGWDAGAAECGMYTCSDHTHIFCEEHALKGVENSHEYNDGDNTIDSKFCPICQMKDIISSDALEYIQCFHPISIRSEIKSKFKNYNEFKEFIRNNHNFCNKSGD